MPEIDTELFQWLVLGLLVLIVIITLVAVSTLSKVRRETSEEGSTAPSPAEQAEPMADQAAASAAAAPIYTSEPEPATVESEDASRAEPSAAAANVSAGAVEALPEEEPFERDGRWWYKRGGELLMYDEGSGQWQTAPPGSLSSTAASSVTTGPSPDVATTQEPTAVSAPAAGASEEPSGSFWKCPSCGAINGATAASCRMCFTSKP